MSQQACPPRTHSWARPPLQQAPAASINGAWLPRGSKRPSATRACKCSDPGTAQRTGLCSLCLYPTKRNTPRPNDCRCQPYHAHKPRTPPAGNDVMYTVHTAAVQQTSQSSKHSGWLQNPPPPLVHARRLQLIRHNPPPHVHPTHCIDVQNEWATRSSRK